MLGLMQGFAGRRAEAQKMYDEMLELSRKTPSSPDSYHLGLISVGLGDFDRALQYFESAYEERDGILTYLGVDPVAESIWPDPRFAALLRKMGLKD